VLRAVAAAIDAAHPLRSAPAFDAVSETDVRGRAQQIL
jgi:hypothetical protein